MRALRSNSSIFSAHAAVSDEACFLGEEGRSKEGFSKLSSVKGTVGNILDFATTLDSTVRE